MHKKSLPEKDRQKIIDYFKHNSNIDAAFLFGSYTTSYFTSMSDIDFAILFKRIIGIKEECEILADISELLETEKIDLVNLNKAPLNLQIKVISEGILLYERDFIRTSDFIEKVLKYYSDYEITLKKFYKEYDEALREAYLHE